MIDAWIDPPETIPDHRSPVARCECGERVSEASEDGRCAACTLRFYIDHPEEFDEPMAQSFLAESEDGRRIVSIIRRYRVKCFAEGVNVYPTKADMLAHYQRVLKEARES